MKRCVGAIALALLAVALGCTETPSDIPECVLPGSACLSPDGGANDAGDAAADAVTDGGLDASALDASDGATGD